MTIDLWRTLIGAIIGAVTFTIFSHMASGRPSQRHMAQRQGVMTISRVYVAGSVMLMGGLGLLMLGPWIVTPSPVPTYVGIGCLVLAMISLASLSSVCDVTWDAQGISAPATFCGMPWPGQRRLFAWEGLVVAGRDLLGNQRVVDNAGRKLRWNFSYRGHRTLTRAIAAYRPDLF